ncbi:MAG TPA: methyl-accepting chemotaxis protein [Myxococcota bacterium]|nr:methyl-accepting chemotaxis protein [Myxococcota bacterium]
MSAATTLGTLLAFGAALRALEPAAIPAVFSVLRLAVQGLVCSAASTAIAWGSAARALADLGAPDHDASGGLDGAHRTPGRFAAASFAIWMLCAAIGILVEPGGAESSFAADRLIAFAALGFAAAAANTLLVARVMAPVAEALAPRVPAARRARAARPLPLAWTLRLLATSLVLVPVVLDALVSQARAREGAGVAGALGSPLAVSLIALAFGLVLAELVSAQMRRAAASLRAAARGAMRGASEGIGGSGEFSEVFEALDGLSRSIQDALDALRGAAAELGAGFGELDGARERVGTLADAQVADVQRLAQSMSTVYAHSEKNAESIQDLRLAVDESSSAVTQLGAAGEQLVGTARELTSRADTVSSSIQHALATLGDVASATDVLAGVAADASSSMEQMASSMSAVNDNAERCSALSDQVVSVADQGSRIVQQTMDGMHVIREATATAERVVRGLGDRAGEIGAIVDVIDGVANETSLLALNAAIIAAQAGEHGRGFSVVAGEIRELATRVSSSTAEITNLIRSVQDESTNAVGAIERGTQSVAKGVEFSEQAGRSLIEITRVARSNKKLVEGIVQSVREQTKAATHVVGVIEEVSSQAGRIRSAARDQQMGNDVVLEQANAMKDMAKQVHRTADEQSRGTRLIVETVENVRSATDKMASSVAEQTAGCARVVASTWEAFTRAKETREATGTLASAVERVRANADKVDRLVAELRSPR